MKLTAKISSTKIFPQLKKKKTTQQTLNYDKKFLKKKKKNLHIYSISILLC